MGLFWFSRFRVSVDRRANRLLRFYHVITPTTTGFLHQRAIWAPGTPQVSLVFCAITSQNGECKVQPGEGRYNAGDCQGGSKSVEMKRRIFRLKSAAGALCRPCSFHKHFVASGYKWCLKTHLNLNSYRWDFEKKFFRHLSSYLYMFYALIFRLRGKNWVKCWRGW